MQDVCVEPNPSLLPAQAKGRPAVHTGIALLARSKPGIYSRVWWVVWKEGQVKNCILPSSLTSSCPKTLNLYKILLAQLQYKILLPAASQSKPESSAERLSLRKSLTPNIPTSQWFAETSPGQHSLSHRSLSGRHPTSLSMCPPWQPISWNMPASKNNTNFCSGSGEPRTLVYTTYKAWCEKQFKWPEVTGSYPYIQAFQAPAACETYLGNSNFILLNCHGQLSWLSVAIREEKTVSVGRDYKNISFHSVTDNEGPAEQYKTEEIRVSTLHPWQNIPTY